jgi:hypothetical protein
MHTSYMSFQIEHSDIDWSSANHKAFNSTEECCRKSYFVARNPTVTHRYCGSTAYFDSPILRFGIILWLTGTAALLPIMTHIVTHRHCGTKGYYNSPLLGAVSYYDSPVLLH